MILLESTTDKIQVVTSTGADVDVHASYIDYDGTTTTPGRKNTAITTAATTDVTGSPASSTHRNVKTLSVRNIDTIAQTAKVQHTDGSTTVTLIQASLGAGETLVYFDGGDGGNWRMYDANGVLKQVSLLLNTVASPLLLPYGLLGSQTVPAANYMLVRKRLQLTGTQRLTVQGTGRVGFNN